MREETGVNEIKKKEGVEGFFSGADINICICKIRNLG
jgi:hypothetical protein